MKRTAASTTTAADLVRDHKRALRRARIDAALHACCVAILFGLSGGLLLLALAEAIHRITR